VVYDATTGKRREMTQTFDTKKDAKNWAEKEAAQYREDPNRKPPSEETVGEYLTRWLDIKKTMTIEAETVLGYRQRADHIQRDLGTIPLKQLTPIDIQAFYAHLTEDRHLSARTVNFTHTVLKMALQDAVEWGVILRNPAAKAKAKARPGLRTQTLRIPTPEEMAQLIRANRQTRWYPLWVWFVVTGSRLGEALALQWQDIDWEKGQVTIRRALSGDAARRILKHPKSASGVRTLQMGPKLTRILQEHARNQQDWQRLAGSQWVESGHVFTTQQGKLLGKRNIERAFKQALARAALPDAIRIHDLRHGSATQWLSAGVNPKLVSERLGHSNVAFTLQVYGHVLPHEESRLVGPMEDALLDSPESPADNAERAADGPQKHPKTP
jgi:integrase